MTSLQQEYIVLKNDINDRKKTPPDQINFQFSLDILNFTFNNMKNSENVHLLRLKQNTAGDESIGHLLSGEVYFTCSVKLMLPGRKVQSGGRVTLPKDMSPMVTGQTLERRTFLNSLWRLWRSFHCFFSLLYISWGTQALRGKSTVHCQYIVIKLLVHCNQITT